MFFTTKRLIFNVLLAVISVCVYLHSNYALAMNSAELAPAPVYLRHFIQRILPNHPRLITAQAEFDAVTAQYSAATKAIYNPELWLDVENTDIHKSTIGISQRIDWGDQRGANTRIAQRRLDAAKASFERDRQQLIRDLLFTLVEYQNKTRLAELSRQRLKVMEDFYHFAKQKRAAGDLDQVELDLAQLAYSESVLNNAKVLAEQVDAEQAFYAISGTEASNSALDLPISSDHFQAVNMPVDMDDFILTLPQMRIVRAGVEASKSTIDLRESESSPDPTIAIRGGKEDQESLAGLTLTIPLNVRNNYSAEIDAARNNYLQAEQTAQQAFRDLRRDVVGSTKHYQLIRSAWAQWQSTGQISMHRQLELLKQLWRAGDMSATDYLVQIKQNLDTQSAGIELNSTLWSSWLNWLEVTSNIDSWLQLNDKRNP